MPNDNEKLDQNVNDEINVDLASTDNIDNSGDDIPLKTDISSDSEDLVVDVDSKNEDSSGIGYDDNHDELQAATGEFFKIAALDPSESAMKSRRKMRITIIVIIVVIIVSIAAGYYVLSSQHSQRNAQSIESNTGINASDIDLSASIQSEYATIVPDLSSLVGLSLDDASSALGVDYLLSESEGQNSSDNGSENENSIATLIYSPADLGDTTLTNPPTVVLTTNEEGVVISVEFTSALTLVGLPGGMTFAELVATSDVLDSVLDSCGIIDGLSSYEAPSADSYTTYVDPDAESRVVAMESSTFSGSVTDQSDFSSWTVEFVYDYQADGATQDDPVRTITITLS